MTEKNEHVLDLDALVDDTPHIVKIGGKEYKFDPSFEDIGRLTQITGGKPTTMLSEEQLREFVVILLPEFPMNEIKNVKQLFRLVTFLNEGVQDLTGITDEQIREFMEKQGSGSSRPLPLTVSTGDTSQPSS